jgi:hypothetical protein
MKSLYDEKYFRYTEDAIALSSEAHALLKPAFEKYMEMGYSPREISQIIQTEVGMVECQIVLCRTSKDVKKKNR